MQMRIFMNETLAHCFDEYEINFTHTKKTFSLIIEFSWSLHRKRKINWSMRILTGG